MAKKKLRLVLGRQYRRRDGFITDPLVFTSDKGWFDQAHGEGYLPLLGGLCFGSEGHHKADLVAEHKGAAETKEAVCFNAGAASLALDVIKELRKAAQAFPPMNSAHEGWGILREEYLELERELMRKQSDPGRAIAIKREAIQVAAMALRLILDCCEKGSPGYGK